MPAAVAAALVPAEQPGHRRDVVEHGAVREQAALLDHVADPPAQLVRRERQHVLAVDPDASRRRLDQPVDHPQGRRLAATGAAEEHDHLAGRDRERQVVDGDVGGRAVAEALGDPIEDDAPLRTRAVRSCVTPERVEHQADVGSERVQDRAGAAVGDVLVDLRHHLVRLAGRGAALHDLVGHEPARRERPARGWPAT